MPLLPTRREERAPARWDPLHELEDMHHRMGRLLESTLGDVGGLAGEAAWSPLVDIEETDDAWIVEADLPGVKRGDVGVELRDGELAISGELKKRERTGLLRRQTRRTGRFDYRVTLPGDVDPDSIDASLDQGVLTVRIPKHQGARAHRIEVRGG